MKAAVFNPALATPGNFLRIEEVSTPTLLPSHVLLRVLACGVCRTDLHIVERDLPPPALTIIPGHQIVIVAINAIHLDQIPAFDYDSLLWGERQIRSVANMTRTDAHDFLQIALKLNLRLQVTTFPLAEANAALLAVKQETENGPAVIVP